MENKKRIAPDQIICAIPAALFILTPLLDVFINYFQSITSSLEYETFRIIPYLPIAIVAVLLISFVILFIRSSDRHFIKAAFRRTYTFQTTLLLFVLYLGLVLMSIGVNGFTYYAVHGHPYTKMSMWTYMANVILFLFISSLVYDERVKKFLVRMCCYIASAYALYGMISYILNPYRGSLRVTYHNSNHYGYYLAVSIALTSAMIIDMLSTKAKEDNRSGKVIDLVIWCLMLIVQCFALGYNNTLGVWISVVMAHLFLFIVYRIKDGKFNLYVLVPFAIFFCTSIISSLFTTSIFTSIIRTFTDVGNITQGLAAADEAGSGRWKIWKATVRHIIDRPVFGNGIEGLLEIITLEGISTGSPHNEFLEYTAFFGIPAGLSYIAACTSVFIHGLKYRKELNPATLICMVGAFGYLVSSFFGVCFYYTVTYPFIFLGLSLNFASKDRPKPAAGQTEPSSEQIAADSEQIEPAAGQIEPNADDGEEAESTGSEEDTDSGESTDISADDHSEISEEEKVSL